MRVGIILDDGEVTNYHQELLEVNMNTGVLGEHGQGEVEQLAQILAEELENEGVDVEQLKY